MARSTLPVTTETPRAESASSDRPWLHLFDAAAGRGFTVADFARMVAALKAPNPRAALCDWLASETRPVMRRGLLAGLAAMEVA